MKGFYPLPRTAATDFALVGVLMLMWGSAFALIEIALPHLSPYMIAFLRLAIAAVFVALYTVFCGHGLPQSLHHWAYCFALGLFGFALPFMMVPLGQEYVNSATAAVLMAFTPISTLVLAHFLTHDERMTRRRIVGVAMGFTGVLLLFGGGLDVEDMGLGAAILLGAAFCYAVAGIIMKKMRAFSDVASSTGALIAATGFCTPALAIRGDFEALGQIGSVDAAALASVAVLAIGPTGVAAILVLLIVRRRGATFSATSNYGVPVVGVLIGALFLKEDIGWNILVTLCLILGAIWLARTPVQSRSKQSQINA